MFRDLGLLLLCLLSIRNEDLEDLEEGLSNPPDLLSSEVTKIYNRPHDMNDGGQEC